MNTAFFDVIVVGAGVAGLSASYHCIWTLWNSKWRQELIAYKILSSTNIQLMKQKDNLVSWIKFIQLFSEMAFDENL